MAQGSLAFDDDDVGVLTFERFDDGGFHLAGAELAGNGVESDAVAGALDQSGLAGSHQDSLDSLVVQRSGEDRRRRSLADGTVRAEHRDSRTGHLGNAAAEHAEIPLVAGSPDVEDRHAVGGGGCRELGIVVEELVEPVHDADALLHGAEHDVPLGRGEHAAERSDTEDQEVRLGVMQSDRCREVRDDRDVVGAVAEDIARVAAGLGAVDHRQDLVSLGVAYQPVGGLAVDGSEVGLAEDDGGGAAVGDAGKVARRSGMAVRHVGHGSPRDELRGGDGLSRIGVDPRATSCPHSA